MPTGSISGQLKVILQLIFSTSNIFLYNFCSCLLLKLQMIHKPVGQTNVHKNCCVLSITSMVVHLVLHQRSCTWYYINGRALGITTMVVYLVLRHHSFTWYYINGRALDITLLVVHLVLRQWLCTLYYVNGRALGITSSVVHLILHQWSCT